MVITFMLHFCIIASSPYQIYYLHCIGAKASIQIYGRTGEEYFAWYLGVIRCRYLPTNERKEYVDKQS